MIESILWMAAGATLYVVVEYLWTTDWEDERRRMVDPEYDALRGPFRTRRGWRHKSR